MAVDSSHIALPRDEALRAYYGATGNELSAPTARASLLYDETNDIIADALFEPLRGDERTLAKRHSEVLDGMKYLPRRKMIVICDRGYPSGSLLSTCRIRK